MIPKEIGSGELPKGAEQMVRCLQDAELSKSAPGTPKIQQMEYHHYE